MRAHAAMSADSLIAKLQAPMCGSYEMWPVRSLYKFRRKETECMTCRKISSSLLLTDRMKPCG